MSFFGGNRGSDMTEVAQGAQQLPGMADMVLGQVMSEKDRGEIDQQVLQMGRAAGITDKDEHGQERLNFSKLLNPMTLFFLYANLGSLLQVFDNRVTRAINQRYQPVKEEIDTKAASGITRVLGAFKPLLQDRLHVDEQLLEQLFVSKSEIAGLGSTVSGIGMTDDLGEAIDGALRLAVTSMVGPAATQNQMFESFSGAIRNTVDNESSSARGKLLIRGAQLGFGLLGTVLTFRERIEAGNIGALKEMLDVADWIYRPLKNLLMTPVQALQIYKANMADPETLLDNLAAKKTNLAEIKKALEIIKKNNIKIEKKEIDHVVYHRINAYDDGDGVELKQQENSRARTLHAYNAVSDFMAGIERIAESGQPVPNKKLEAYFKRKIADMTGRIITGNSEEVFPNTQQELNLLLNAVYNNIGDETIQGALQTAMEEFYQGVPLQHIIGPKTPSTTIAEMMARQGLTLVKSEEDTNAGMILNPVLRLAIGVKGAQTDFDDIEEGQRITPKDLLNQPQASTQAVVSQQTADTMLPAQAHSANAVAHQAPLIRIPFNGQMIDVYDSDTAAKYMAELAQTTQQSISDQMLDTGAQNLVQSTDPPISPA